MITEATAKVIQVLSKVEGVSSKSGKAWEKYTYLMESLGKNPTSIVVRMFNYGDSVGTALELGKDVRMTLRIEAHPGAKDKSKWYNEVSIINVLEFN